MSKIVTTYEGSETSQAIIGRDVRLVFTWLDDRWSHVLMPGRTGDRLRPVVLSHQQDEREVDDGSTAINQPVFQQLHFQDDRDGCLAMLVGQAGHEHYSSCIRFSEQDDGRTYIDFDIANRQTRPSDRAPSLAPTYLVDLPLTELEEASHRLARWNSGEPKGHLMLGTLEPTGGATVLLISEAGRRGSLVQVFTRHDPSAPAQRCQFRWTWEMPMTAARE